MPRDMDLDNAPPFFIVGASRSGTTLLRLMLNAHSLIAVPHEMKYFNRAIPLPTLRQWRQPDAAPADFDNIIDDWLKDRSHSFEPIGVEKVRQAIADGPRNVRAPLEIALQMWARHHGKRLWGEKTPNHLYYVDFIVEMFPQARFVYLVRDPRAVVRSMNNIAFFPDDSVINAHNWKVAATEGWKRLCRSVDPDKRFVLRYESLVSEPDESLRALCTFLAVPFEPDMLDFHERSSSALPQKIRTPNIRKSVDPSSLDKWRDELSDDEVAAIERVCGSPMKHFGYPHETPSMGWNTQLDLGLKTMYWIWKKWQDGTGRGFTIEYEPLGQLPHS